MNKIQALNAFWSSFGLPAYDETSVPDTAQMPYLTYESTSDSFGNTIAQTSSLWYRSTSWQAITLKEMEISESIGRGGKMIAFEGGAIWVRKGVPWAQRMADATDDSVRRIVLNVEIEYVD